MFFFIFFIGFGLVIFLKGDFFGWFNWIWVVFIYFYLVDEEVEDSRESVKFGVLQLKGL